MVPGKDYSPDEILAIAWRRRWQLLVPCLVVALGAAAVAYMLPDRFRSETLIMIVPQRIPEEYVRPTVTAKIEERVQSIRNFLMSRSTLERTILELDLYKAERNDRVMEDVVAGMRGHIFLDIDRADSFRLTYEADDPVTAQKVAARLTNLIIEASAKDRQGLAIDTSDFLESELGAAEHRLAEQERKLAAFRREHSGELPEQLGSIVQAIQNRQIQLQNLSDSLARDRSEKLLAERLRGDMSTPSTSQDDAQGPRVTPGTPDTMSAVSQLDAARAELRRLELTRTPDHPDIRAAKRRVEALEKQVKEEAAVASGSRPVSAAELARLNRLRELEAQILNLDRQISHKEATERQLHEEIRGYQARSEAVPLRESQLTALNRGYETLQQTYQGLLKKKEDSKIAENLERRRAGEQFNILDPAGLPERPFSPNRPLILLVGLAAGMALGATFAAVLEFRDRSLRSETDVHLTLQLPVLAVLPVLETVEEQARTRRLRLTASIAAGLLLVIVGVMVALRLES